MYLDYFGLDSAPFNITSQTDFFFDGAARGATLDALLYAVQQGEGIVKVTGEVGSGKTMLCRMLLESLPDNVETIFLSVPSLKRDEILQALCIELGVNIGGGNSYQLLTALQDKLIDLYAANRRVVALIDEAHAMPLESLEQIRLLTNLENGDHKLLQIILFGQPELDDHLRLTHMRQLKERITHSFNLSPLQKSEVGPYLEHRLESAGYQGAPLFSDKCIKLIADASEGLTRRINIIADKSLLAAYAEDTKIVTPAHVRAAIRDSDFPLPNQWGHRIAIATATLAAAGLVGFGLSKSGWLSPAAVQSEAVASKPPASDVNKSNQTNPGTVKTAETKLESGVGLDPIEGSPEWHERNINKNNRLSKYVESINGDVAAQAGEAKNQENAAIASNSAENTFKSADLSSSLEKNKPLTGFDLDSKIKPADNQPTASAPKQSDEATSAKTTLISDNSGQNQANIIQPQKSTSSDEFATAKVAQLAVTSSKPFVIKPANKPAEVRPVSATAIGSGSPSPFLQERIASSKNWLESQPGSQCLIQLLMADINNHGNVEYFLNLAERQTGAKSIHVFPSEINGHGKYIVVYAMTGMNCQAAMGKLSAPLRQSKPYIRSVELLRNEVKFPA
ncbi:MAG: AAA family ATPase [Burkholderiales bacterium]